MYWTAFCYAELGNVTQAKSVWRKLPTRFPRSPKIADSLFQRATLCEQEGENREASGLYRELIKYFPRAEKYKESLRAVKRLDAFVK